MSRALAAALLLSIASVASAQPTPAPPAPEPSPADRAAALYDEGKRHFDIAEYTAAIASWKQAYLLSSEPLLLFNIAQAYRLAGNCAEANRFYLNYKRAVPAPSNQAELTTAMEKCAGVEPATGESTDGAAAGASTGTGAGTATGTGAGSGTATGTGSGSGSGSGSGAGAGAGAGAVVLHEAHPGRNLRIAGYVVVGLGAVSGAVAVLSTMSASSKASAVGDQPPGTVWSPSLAGTQSDGQAAATRAKVFGGLGIAAVVTGGVLWWLGHRAETNVQVGVALAPHNTGVTLSCAF